MLQSGEFGSPGAPRSCRKSQATGTELHILPEPDMTWVSLAFGKINSSLFSDSGLLTPA